MIFLPFSIAKNIIPCSYRAPFPHLTSCTPTNSNLYLANSLATVVSEPDLYRLNTVNLPNLMSLFHCLGRTKRRVQDRGKCIRFVTRPVFYVEDLLAPLPPLKLEDRPLLAVRDCLFNILPLSSKLETVPKWTTQFIVHLWASVLHYYWIWLLAPAEFQSFPNGSPK